MEMRRGTDLNSKHPQPFLMPYLASMCTHSLSTFVNCCTSVLIPPKPTNFQEHAGTKPERNRQIWHLNSQADFHMQTWTKQKASNVLMGLQI